MTSDWVLSAHEIQAVAQTGLAFEPDQYDRDRYEPMQRLAARMIAHARDGNLPTDFE